MFDNILECDLEEEQLSSSLDEEQLSWNSDDCAGSDLDDGDESDDSSDALLGARWSLGNTGCRG